MTITIDFETYSPAGFVWNGKSWDGLPGASKKGLPCVGAARYSEHPGTEVLCLSYSVLDGAIAMWTPGQPRPHYLFECIRTGIIIEAWNCAFEYWIWTNVCVKKYGWPAIPPRQLRDAAARARAWALPGKLEEAGNVLNIATKKDRDGKRLITKFCIPRSPTKSDPRRRIHPHEDTPDAERLYSYNRRDVEAEAAVMRQTPELPQQELEYWFCDQAINQRGVQIDVKNVRAGIEIVDQALTKYNKELTVLTGGVVETASQTLRLKQWVNYMCPLPPIPDVTEPTVAAALNESDLPPSVRRALEIRQLIGSAAVKKPAAMNNQMTEDGRLHDLFIYHGARTGRAAGTGPQPQNLPNHGPNVWLCGCGRHYLAKACPWCGSQVRGKFVEWNENAALDALETISTGSLECVEYFWTDALAVLSGCLRALFISAPGKDLICSDYSSIEAVVLAALAGEEWRLEVFRTHGKIYEMSASKITGIPFEEFLEHERVNKVHHPMRKKIGKTAELASGYQGFVGAWKRFGADKYFNDDEIREAVLAWRAASPNICNMWKNLEYVAHAAVMNKGQCFTANQLTYICDDKALYCYLPSGRYLTYHRPILSESQYRDGLQLSFEGYNSNPTAGPIGWTRMDTYGGKLTENGVQAVARDIFMHGIWNLERAGYAIVLHTHDEPVAEVPEGWGSVAEFEQIMNKLPNWCSDWPIVARGGWRAKRYRK